jgi:carbon monoxide dehydrogenase subunit G
LREYRILPAGEQARLGNDRPFRNPIEACGTLNNMATDALELTGEESFAAPPDQLFGKLVDLEFLAGVLPDVESCQMLDATTLSCVVRPGFSFLRGKLTVTIAVVEQNPPTSARLDVVSKGIGTTSRVDAALQIEPAAAGSLLRWQMQVVERKGLVAAVSKSLIAGAAEEVVRKTMQRVRDKLATS